MAETQHIAPDKLETLLNNAIDLTENRTDYVTHIRLNITNNEVTLDFYYVASNPRNPSGEPEAHRIRRIIMPPGLAKNVGQLLVNSMTGWEEAFGITLPLSPNENLVELTHDDPNS